jgi:hypothetical protein
MKEKQVSIQEAVDWLGELVKARIDQYVTFRANVPSWGETVDAEVEQYLMGIDHLIVGALSWSFETIRYFGKERASVKQNLTVTLLPGLYGHSR